ncbi:PAS domain S-box protein [Brevundimonas sp.]|uniref:PAS domain-containing sensor histidine kinase n=1 Tax=Brevundimonas sp. TaxID=1871086 RepID=UPI002D6C3ED9|nr:PAS domain S-box protein [Brevundimonas sp.]HYC73859.1 PAS domain S-box protein [Brevundimonas sp.]
MTQAEVQYSQASRLTEFEALVAAAPSAIEAIPGAVYLCDADGWLVRYNREAVAMWGRDPAQHGPQRFCGSHRLFLLDGTFLPHEDCPMAEAVVSGTETRNVEVVVERPDGSRLTALVNIRALRDHNGKIQGAINCFQDISAHKELEKAMTRSNRDLEDFFENSAVGLHIVSGDGIILRANKAELALLGYTADEYVGRHIAEFHADEQTIGEILTCLSHGGTLDRHPARLRAKDGSLRHVLITSNSRFEDGKFLSTRCFTVDVTELQQSERALRESDERLAATYEAATVGIAEVDESGRYIRVNDALCGILGRSREQLLATTLLDITHPDDRELEREQYQRQVRGEQPSYTTAKRVVRPDGEIAHVEVSSSSVRDDEGRFRYGVRVLQDVTERLRMQRRIEDDERRLRELLEFLPAAIYTTDADGRITFYNEAAVQLAGREPVLGSDTWCVTWKLYWPDGTPMPHDQCPMAVALRENRPVRDGEAVAERPDGTRVPFIPYPTPLRDGDGRLVGAINMLVDISDRKEAEARQKVLIDELNHRVKNTLATVQSLALQTLKHSDDLPDFANNFESRLIALARAHDLLTERNWMSAPLYALVRDIVAPYSAGTDRLRIGGPTIALNPRAALALTMVFSELATNAAKFGSLSEPDGALTVRWEISPSPESAVTLEWLEAAGPEVSLPTRQGFGTRLIRRCIERDLDGEINLHFDPAGFRADIRIPLGVVGADG